MIKRSHLPYLELVIISNVSLLGRAYIQGVRRHPGGEAAFVIVENWLAGLQKGLCKPASTNTIFGPKLLVHNKPSSVHHSFQLLPPAPNDNAITGPVPRTTQHQHNQLGNEPLSSPGIYHTSIPIPPHHWKSGSRFHPSVSPISTSTSFPFIYG